MYKVFRDLVKVMTLVLFLSVLLIFGLYARILESYTGSTGWFTFVFLASSAMVLLSERVLYPILGRGD